VFLVSGGKCRDFLLSWCQWEACSTAEKPEQQHFVEWLARSDGFTSHLVVTERSKRTGVLGLDHVLAVDRGRSFPSWPDDYIVPSISVSNVAKVFPDCTSGISFFFFYKKPRMIGNCFSSLCHVVSPALRCLLEWESWAAPPPCLCAGSMTGSAAVSALWSRTILMKYRNCGTLLVSVHRATLKARYYINFVQSFFVTVEKDITLVHQIIVSC